MISSGSELKFLVFILSLKKREEIFTSLVLNPFETDSKSIFTKRFKSSNGNENYKHVSVIFTIFVIHVIFGK